MSEIKDGDVFRWSYKRDVKRGDHSYWRKSRIAIAENGVLFDTYWSISNRLDGNCRHWTYDEAVDTLNLTFLGNLADLERVSEGEGKYYDEADIVNLNHANSSRGNFYIRKGSQRSREKMLRTARHGIERHEADICSAQHAIERLKEAIAKIEAGADLSGIWL